MCGWFNYSIEDLSRLLMMVSIIFKALTVMTDSNNDDETYNLNSSQKIKP